MKKFATFASDFRINALVCCSAAVLLSACGAGMNDAGQPSQIAAATISSADQSAAKGAVATSSAADDTSSVAAGTSSAADATSSATDASSSAANATSSSANAAGAGTGEAAAGKVEASGGDSAPASSSEVPSEVPPNSAAPLPEAAPASAS